MLSLGSFKTGAILLVRDGGFAHIHFLFYYFLLVSSVPCALLFKKLSCFELQAGLFVYDIFWVFFTPVMVSVAKSFDAPIKVSISCSSYLDMALWRIKSVFLMSFLLCI